MSWELQLAAAAGRAGQLPSNTPKKLLRPIALQQSCAWAAQHMPAFGVSRTTTNVDLKHPPTACHSLERTVCMGRGCQCAQGACLQQPAAWRQSGGTALACCHACWQPRQGCWHWCSCCGWHTLLVVSQQAARMKYRQFTGLTGRGVIDSQALSLQQQQQHCCGGSAQAEQQGACAGSSTQRNTALPARPS